MSLDRLALVPGTIGVDLPAPSRSNIASDNLSTPTTGYVVQLIVAHRLLRENESASEILDTSIKCSGSRGI